jgi:hypothetical protein
VIFSVELSGHAPVDVMARSRVDAKADGKVRGYAVLSGHLVNGGSFKFQRPPSGAHTRITVAPAWSPSGALSEKTLSEQHH